MTRYGSADVGFILFDGYDLLGISTELSLDVEALLEETTALGDAWQQMAPVGLRRWEASINGFYDDDWNRNVGAFVGKTGLSRVGCLGIETNTFGRRFIGLAGAVELSVQRVASRGEMHKLNVDLRGSGAVEDGIVLHPQQGETAASGTGPVHDNGASTANGGAGYLQVTGLTLGGYTSVTIKVQHSADNVSWTDLVVFTNVTSVLVAERKAVSGTINRYTRVSWAFNGTGSGQSIGFMAGLARF